MQVMKMSAAVVGKASVGAFDLTSMEATLYFLAATPLMNPTAGGSFPRWHEDGDLFSPPLFLQALLSSIKEQAISNQSQCRSKPPPSWI